MEKMTVAELSNKKRAWAEKHGVTIREVTKADYDYMREHNYHITDYMCFSSFILEYKGHEQFSKKATYEDLKDLIDYVENESERV